MLKTVLVIFIAIFGFLIVLVSLIMSPHSNSFSGALIGSSDLDLFQVSKERGIKKFTKWAMFILGFIFLVLSLVIRLL
ncbi:preprotein translocase subunit SecG [Mesomycoplasma ovipneumoniae]|uniref:Protein-export membrane protein SecG n=1 Tax=Mesomycoplasma ovipneumoniae TaxID=29562 RepID=A0AAW6Q8J1_9BACT|nr:preprotein translocase subunit SecG [Mesomycoplasma ovipneumoniae]MCN0157773.1 preprotein translocase subunit SecG [Mesomycoplasma ovipneumoniae]MDF9627549.1 preprotein translocase subunit SecG [Mesomycoplasma ovipneumoniae]MDO4157723.1 preprotein translocase subunit SecG [Mesomycoplasma ovipneumoniae]MDO4158326.1 preprotein translocase subunit SecG [Mesomycoplasma ovipneumoniae]MDO6821681.1 preprotein translocase subunit SecG [Mesomycoplasma ovipneumoniae]